MTKQSNLLKLSTEFDNGATGITQYTRLATIFRHRILKGEWPVGHRLPTVEALARQYSVARITGRQALATLASEGLVTSRRGVGTIVTGAPGGPGEGLVAAINDPLNKGSNLKIEVLEKRLVSELPLDLAGGGEAPDTFVLIKKTHFQDGAVFCCMEVYVDADTFNTFPAGAEAASQAESHHVWLRLSRRSSLWWESSSAGVQCRPLCLAKILSRGGGCGDDSPTPPQSRKSAPASRGSGHDGTQATGASQYSKHVTLQ